jgi:hypothetical protein
MKYCQSTRCHKYKTKDRIRGTKGSKYYATRRRSQMYYGNGNFCCQTCLYDWINEHIESALNHFGRITEPKKVLCDQAWYKDYKYNYNGEGQSRYSHFIINDLLGEKRPITEQQYNDENYNINSS